MMPTPPLKRSIFRMPKGLKISNRRKSTNAASAYRYIREESGTASSGIHTPTISSMTTRDGSSPQIVSTAVAAGMPRAVNRTTHVNVPICSTSKGKNNEAIPHKRRANNAPAVPGAIGEYPEPNPVAINICIFEIYCSFLWGYNQNNMHFSLITPIKFDTT